jgi:hypothetical protein
MKNSTSQIDLLYLTNMSCKINNEADIEIVDKKEVEFYKKRIFQLCKDILRKNVTDPNVVSSFNHFCSNAIDYFKMNDTTEMIQSEYDELSIETSLPFPLPKQDLSSNLSGDSPDLLMFKKIEKPNDTLDKFVIKHVVKKNDDMVIPEQKIYNLNDVKYQEKGVKVKAKTSSVAINNKKKKNNKLLKEKMSPTTNTDVKPSPSQKPKNTRMLTKNKRKT